MQQQEDHADEALAAAAAEGDDRAFAALHRRYRPVALRSARRAARTHPALDVEEAANLALARLWEVLSRFDTDREFAPWAAVVIAHSVRSSAAATRSLKAQMNWSAMLASSADPEGDRLAELSAIPDGEPDALAVVLLGEEEQQVAAVLRERLSPREAKVVRLRLAGWSYGEIGTRLGMDFKAVDNAMRRGMDKLRRAFDHDRSGGAVRARGTR